ncbi:uncharacterized protein LOC123226731 [Mangifera indica]|uniref:uncharacterized protein LOC123226731 n=1 Tax=Mangifera indica TaxID=29780 RepID=UPI001CFAD8C2|nr:uncharacterized protein LOC123226731 [Mangifera indica]
MGSLQAYEERFKEDDQPVEQTLQTKLTMRDSKSESSNRSWRRGRGRGKRRGCGRQNYGQDKEDEVETNYNQRGCGRGQSSGRGRGNKTEIKCYNCQKFRHYASECWHRKENRVHFVEKEEKMQDDILLLACNSSKASESSTWYLDIGASNHICGSKECFAELNESYSGEIVFGDLSRRLVKGKGQIMLELKNGEHKYIGGVYYVPDMKNNILSMGQLLEKG